MVKLSARCPVTVLVFSAVAMAALAMGAKPAREGPWLDDTRWLGQAKTLDNLTLFPIYDRDPLPLKNFVSLETALKRGLAVVRERGPQAAAPEHARPRSAPGRGVASSLPALQAQGLAAEPNSFEPQVQRQRSGSGGDAATVNTLVIENKSGSSIVVLAGTVVKGGRQDRQIGQDFVIGPRQTVPVDAFCVEQGRWSGERDGKATAGKFTTVNQLANFEVRQAGQYKGSQSEVWANVSEVNAANSVGASSGTLLATLEDKKVSASRDRIARDIAAFLDTVPDQERLVGFAYAVEGEVVGLRWFLNNALFEEFQHTLVNTAAAEAVTARARAGKRSTAGAVEAGDVQRFVAELRAAKVKEKKSTKADNDNTYRESKRGYSSECTTKEGSIPVTFDALAH